ncbi:MAG: HDIG domain-containing protein, partial [Clostridiales bacterium]|nr:HDIG domain-containing protein [Clostridiales bacterium]
MPNKKNRPKNLLSANAKPENDKKGGGKISLHRIFNPDMRRILWWLLFAVISFAVLAFHFFPEQLSLKAGDIAENDVDYRGPAKSYFSQLKTNEAREKAAEKVTPILSLDNEALNETYDEIAKTFSNIWDVVKMENLNDEDKIALLKISMFKDFPDDVLLNLVLQSEAELDNLQSLLRDAIQNAMSSGVREEDLPAAISNVNDSISAMPLFSRDKDFLRLYFETITLRANMVTDNEATDAEREREKARVPDVWVTVQNGERIVSKGSTVDELQIEKLENLGFLKKGSGVIPYLGLALFVAAFYLLLIQYLRSYYPRTKGREANVVLLGVLINFTLLFAKALSLISLSDADLSAQICYLLPIATASMLISMLLGQGIAVFVTIFVAVSSGVLMGGSLPCTIVTMVGGLTGVFLNSGFTQRNNFVRASLYIALANLVSITSMGLIYELNYQLIGIGVLFGLFNALLSAILTIGILPFLETAFKITTSIRLMELSNSNHPLLKRLILEAPGTYHHSVLVGNLAETAAYEIGADPLLVRVSSYYHDIGKIKRPYFFIENQGGGDNPHDNMKISLSKSIIISHVKDGMDLLREYKFPQEIIDSVETHHGNAVLTYFYHKAMEAAANPEDVRKDDFRYPGPLPQTKETALVSLADGVQAAVQS